MRRIRIVVTTMLLVATCVAALPTHAASPFADAAFEQEWLRGEAITPNFWGPPKRAQPGQSEDYYSFTPCPPAIAQMCRPLPAVTSRRVQYFDKGRMELTLSHVVTSGLLATEMIRGQLQLGDSTFQPHLPPAIAMAGDPSSTGATYAALGTTASGLLAPAMPQIGQTIPTTITDAGTLGSVALPPIPPTTVTVFDAPTQHNVPGAFATYRDTAGLTTIGYAISEPFHANVRVDGTQRFVMIQVFERRVLTYTDTNPDAFKVEMGNIGQHYYLWRYGVVAGPSVTGVTNASPAASTYPGKVVYETGTGEGSVPVYVMNADGSGKIWVGDGRSPIFAPDGKRVAFYTTKVAIPNPPIDTVAIRSANLDGSDPRDEATFPFDGFRALVRWSPNGQYIAMNSGRNGPGLIRLLDTTTGAFGDPLTYQQGSVSLIVDWTPDGSAAVWQASVPDANATDLYFGNPASGGAGAVQLTHGENQAVVNLSHSYACARISPDGKTIAIAGSKVFFVSVPGQQSPLDGKSIDGTADAYTLAWSPDGRALAVSTGPQFSRNGTGRAVSIIDVASGQVVTTVEGAGRADWSRQ